MVKPMTQKELRGLSLKDLRMRIKELNTAAKANNTDEVKAALATAQAALDRKCDQLELVQDNAKTSTSGPHKLVTLRYIDTSSDALPCRSAAFPFVANAPCS